MRSVVVSLPLWLLLLTGCCKSEDDSAASGRTVDTSTPNAAASVDEPADEPEDAGDVDYEDVWPDKAVAGLKDALGQGAATFDEETLLRYIEANRKRQDVIKAYLEGGRTDKPLSDVVEELVKKEGFQDNEGFEVVESRIISANVVLKSLQAAEAMLAEAAETPALKAFADAQIAELGRTLEGADFRPTIDDLKLVFKHRDALVPQIE